MQKGTPGRRSPMISARIIVTACGALLLILTSAMGTQVSNKVITWGENSPEWDRALHLGAVRLGCSGVPNSCAGYAQQTSRSQGTSKAFLAILLDSQKTPDYMRQYSQLSMANPALYEVGFDDFVNQCEKQNLSTPALSALLNSVVVQLKSANPNLHLGITLYEDEIYAPRFSLADLDPQFRKSVDFVHLYPHYRKEQVKFSQAVQQAKELFPSAKVIAGLYPYDRRDYLPCTRGNSTPCTNDEEVSLFADSLKERLAMLASSEVEWIEFYPGNFGMESQWGQWKSSRNCHPDRIQECADNTYKMREIVGQMLNQ